MFERTRVIDLSAPLDGATVVWPGTPPITARTVDDFAGAGSFSQVIQLPEHIGTHLDAPIHYQPGGHDVASLSAASLFCPLVVIDLSVQAARDPDVSLDESDVHDFERRHGPITAGSAVFLRTDFSLRRTDPAAYRGGDVEESMHFPGFGAAAARLLVERRVAGLGVDTLSVDPGVAIHTPVHRDIALPAGLWQLENLINLDQLPSVGAWVCVGVPRVVGASGFPARVIALVPSTA